MARIGGSSDTIAAAATPIGEAAVGIVRLSGNDAVAIVDKIFRAKNKKPLATLGTFSLRYGRIVDAGGRPVDEVIVALMRAPRSYTREDVVEINSHGGIRALSSILEMTLAQGARLAEPGEFTRRAFLDGRLDLGQAEAVLDIIQAKSELALKNSLAQLHGDLSRSLHELRSGLLEILADMEAALDFSEEENSRPANDAFKTRISKVMSRLTDMIERGLKGKMIREGVSVVIAGRPNVGKSSLLNALLRRERAIVTSIAGTTRDTIEEYISIKGLAVRLIDTAGVIEGPARLTDSAGILNGRTHSSDQDPIEKEALARTRRALEQADLVLFVIDGAAALTDQDRRLSQTLDGKHSVIVINKCDRHLLVDRQEARSLLPDSAVIEVSALEGKNIAALEAQVYQSVFENGSALGEGALISHARHIETLTIALKSLQAAYESLSDDLSLEFVAVDVKRSLDKIGEMTGEVFSDEVLDQIFSKFCVGK